MFGMTIPAGAYFVVSDREKTDMELSKLKDASIVNMQVQNAVPNVEKINNSFFKRGSP